MQPPSSLTVWLGEQAIPVLMIAVLLAFVMVVLSLSARNRRIRMNEARSGTNEDTFVASLAVYGFDPRISRAVYSYLQEKQNVRFPIEASDLLDEDLGLDLPDLEETIRDVFQICQRIYQPGLRYAPLTTVEDLVRFIQASPRMVQAAA